MIDTKHGIELSSEIKIPICSQCIIVRILLYYLESIKHFIIHYDSIQCASACSKKQSTFFDSDEKITEVQKILWCIFIPLVLL